MTPDPNVSELLKRWRAQSRPRLLQEDAAKILGVSLRTLQGWEEGRSCPYPKTVELAIEALCLRAQRGPAAKAAVAHGR